MNSGIVTLVFALQEQLDVFKELNSLLLEEQEAIVSLDTVRMEQLNSLKEPVVARQFRAADGLRDALAGLSRQAGGAAAKTVSELLQKLPKEAAKEILPLQQAVQKAGNDVNRQAQHNRDLLERFLGTVNDSLGFLLRVLNTSNQYGASGTYIQRAQAGAVMVNREA
jgi:flagellar biosynthesis/type III secretory pathway chaperone